MDRFTIGLILGIAAGVIKNILNLISYYFNFAKATYAHFMAVMLMGTQAKTPIELIVAQIIELLMTGMIGIIFIYYAYRTKLKKNLWLKGMIFGESLFLLFYAIGMIFNLPLFDHSPIQTVISNFITSSVFGISLGLGAYWWGKRTSDFDYKEKEHIKQPRFRMLPQPLRKPDPGE